MFTRKIMIAALLAAAGDHSHADFGDLLERLREDAGEFGANGIAIQFTEEAGTGVFIAGIRSDRRERNVDAIARRMFVPCGTRPANRSQSDPASASSWSAAMPQALVEAHPLVLLESLFIPLHRVRGVAGPAIARILQEHLRDHEGGSAGDPAGPEGIGGLQPAHRLDFEDDPHLLEPLAVRTVHHE